MKEDTSAKDAMDAQTPKKPYKRNFMTDIWRKVVALFLACLTYFVVSGELSRNKEIQNVKLEIPFDTERYVMLNNVPPITLKISCPFPNVEFHSDDFHLMVNPVFPEVKGNFPYKLTLDQKAIPKIVRKKPWMVRIESISPQEINLDMDFLVTKTVTVSPEYEDKTASGYSASVELTPEQLEIRGPSCVLKQINRLPTMRLKMQKDCRTSFEQVCEAVLPAVAGSERVTILDNSLKAKVLVKKDKRGEARGELHLKERPVRILTRCPSPWQAQNPTGQNVDIVLRGEIQDSQERDYTDIEAFIDISSANQAGAFTAEVQLLRLPANCTAQVTPQMVTVTLKRIIEPLAPVPVPANPLSAGGSATDTKR